MHLARADDLSESDLTSGVTADTVFHSDLPYLAFKQYELLPDSEGTVDYPVHTASVYDVVRDYHTYVRFPLSVDAINTLSSSVFLVAFEFEDGSRRLSGCKIDYKAGSRTLDTYSDRNYTYYYKKNWVGFYLGDYNFKYCFHPSEVPQSVFEYDKGSGGPKNWPIIIHNTRNVLHPGYKPGDLYLSCLCPSVKATKAIIYDLNARVVNGQIEALPARAGGTDIYLSRSNFSVGEKTLNGFGYIKGAASQGDNFNGVTNYPTTGVFSEADQINYNIELHDELPGVEVNGYANAVGGGESLSWDFNLAAGSISYIDAVTSQEVALWDVTRDMGGLIYSDVFSLVLPLIRSVIYPSDPHYVKTEVASYFVGVHSEFSGIIYTPDSLMAPFELFGSPKVATDHWRSDMGNPQTDTTSGAFSGYLSLRPGDAFGLFDADIMYINNTDYFPLASYKVRTNYTVEYTADGYLKVIAHQSYIPTPGYPMLNPAGSSEDIEQTQFYFISLV